MIKFWRQVETPKLASVYTPLITVESYLKLVNSGEVLMPPFRRTKQWDEFLMRQYVEGVVSGTGQISMITVGRVENQPYIIVDGLNRTRALKEFYEGRLRAFGKTIDEDPDLKIKFLKAQLVVSFVTVSRTIDLIHLFTTINLFIARPMFTDIFFAYKVVDRKLQLIDDFASEIKKIAETRGEKVANPRMYALIALYYYLNRSLVNHPSFKALTSILKYDEEQIKKAIDFLLDLFRKEKLPREYNLKRLIFKALGQDYDELVNARRLLRGLEVKGDVDPVRTIKKAICLAAESSMTPTFTFNFSASARSLKIKSSRSVVRGIVDELVSIGACSKIHTTRIKVVCDKFKTLEYCRRSFLNAEENSIYGSRGRGEEDIAEVAQKSTY